MADGSTRRLKIAVLVRRFVTSGGKERYAVEVAGRLRERGHEVHIFCREADPALTSGLVVHPVPARFGFSSALSCLAFAWDCARLLRKERFDVVHSHERGYRQDVLTIHTFSYKGGLSCYPLLRRLDQTWLSYRSFVYLWLEKRQMATRHLVAVSGAILEESRQLYGRGEGITIIEPGVDVDRFHPARSGKERDVLRRRFGVGEEELLVLFVGSEFKRKGLDRLLLALGPAMRLVVVGRGDNMPFFAKMIERAGLTDRVHFVGLVTGDVGAFYAGADVVVLPSRSEAFGMSALEAMSSGVPVAVSRECGISPLITDGVEGFVFDSAEELRDILAAMRDCGLRSRLAPAARSKAESYSWERQTDKYEQLFYSLSSRTP